MSNHDGAPDAEEFLPWAGAWRGVGGNRFFRGFYGCSSLLTALLRELIALHVQIPKTSVNRRSPEKTSFARPAPRTTHGAGGVDRFIG